MPYPFYKWVEKSVWVVDFFYVILLFLFLSWTLSKNFKESANVSFTLQIRIWQTICVNFLLYYLRFKDWSIKINNSKWRTILQGLGVGPGSVTEHWPCRKNAWRSAFFFVKKNTWFFFLDVPSSYAKIWGETKFQPWEFPRSGWKA